MFPLLWQDSACLPSWHPLLEPKSNIQITEPKVVACLTVLQYKDLGPKCHSQKYGRILQPQSPCVVLVVLVCLFVFLFQRRTQAEIQ